MHFLIYLFVIYLVGFAILGFDILGFTANRDRIGSTKMEYHGDIMGYNGISCGCNGL